MLRQIRPANCVCTLNNPKSLRKMITGEKSSTKLFWLIRVLRMGYLKMREIVSNLSVLKRTLL